jgi:hypothetical protein
VSAVIALTGAIRPDSAVRRDRHRRHNPSPNGRDAVRALRGRAGLGMYGFSGGYGVALLWSSMARPRGAAPGTARRHG